MGRTVQGSRRVCAAAGSAGRHADAHGSSYRALPALLSDLHEAMGALASGNSSAGSTLFNCSVVLQSAKSWTHCSTV
jgi:hypothetical protein